MQAAMETYNNNKRTAEEAGIISKTSSPKHQQRFYLPPQFDTVESEIQCHVNWTGKKVPVVVKKGFKIGSDGRIRTMAIGTPMLATKFVDLGENGDIGKFGKTEHNASYNMKTVLELPEKITSKVTNAQEKAQEFYDYLNETVQSMIKIGFETDGVWTKWKKAAEKKAAKEKKKNPDTARTAFDIFVEDAKTSMFQTFEDSNGEDIKMYAFSTPYQMKVKGVPTNNRPAFWKQVRTEYGDRSVKNITDELPSKKNGLRHGSVVKFAFELNAYDLDTMYGIKAKLKPNILCVYLPKGSQQSVNEMIGNDTYFSDDED